MAWKEMAVDELAKSLGVSSSEAREKQKLILLIVKTRKKEKISQATLAKRVGVTQSRIAQVESGVGTSKVTFDVLLGILSVLGYDFRILPRRAA